MKSRNQDRIESLDVLRGVAICGILLMTICKMGGTAQYAIDAFPARLDAQWIGWGVQTTLIDGTMRGLFTMLFGASMVLMLRNAEGADGRVGPIDQWARRALALMAFGTVQWLVFLWPGEILWNYGISGLFLLAFRSARVGTLLTAAALLLGALSANNAYRTHEAVVQLQASVPAAAARAAGLPLDGDQRAALAAAAIERSRVRPDAIEVAGEIDRRTHLRSLVKWSEAAWLSQNFGGAGWIEVAESVGFMLIGMALFRAGILTGAASTGTYRRMMIVGYGAGLAGRAIPVILGVRTGLDLTSAAVSPALWAVSDALFQPARLLVTLGHIGLIVTLLRAGWLGRATTLKALGRMALTVYSLQAILGSLLFYGLGWVGQFALPGLWLCAVAIWMVTALFCRLWLSRFAMGPAEQLLRLATRGTLVWPMGRRSRARLVRSFP